MKIQIKALHKTHILQKNKYLYEHTYVLTYTSTMKHNYAFLQTNIYIYIYIYELKFIHMHTYQNTYSHSNIQYTNTFISTRDNTLTKASKFITYIQSFL